MAHGMVVREYPPHWVVVRRSVGNQRGRAATRRYVVVDTSCEPPQKVHGPTTLPDAEAYARVQVQLWTAVHGQVDEGIGS
jgi:hypothetical protein